MARAAVARAAAREAVTVEVEMAGEEEKEATVKVAGEQAAARVEVVMVEAKAAG